MSARDDPVVRSRKTSFADGVFQRLLQREQILRTRSRKRRSPKFGLRFVEWNIWNILLRRSQIDQRLSRRMVAPRAHRIQVPDQMRRELRA